MDKKNTLLQVKNLSFSYGHQEILKNIHFQVELGDFIGIVGPNGSGKTTLLHLLSGVLQPSAGSINWVSQQYHTLLGYIPQNIAQLHLDFPTTVQEIIYSAEQASETKLLATEDIIEMLKLKKLLEVPLHQLSGGQRQRVFLARTLMRNPKILLLDEPTVAIDEEGKTTLIKLLTDINKHFGVSIILVSHDLPVMHKAVQHVYCLNRTIVCHGSVEDVLTPESLQKAYGKDFAFINHFTHHHH